MTRASCRALLGVALLAPAGLDPPAQEPAPAPAPLEAEALLVELEARAAGIRDLEASFRQEKHTLLLKRPLVSTGRVRVRDEQVRWETREPARSVMAITPETVRIHYPEQKVLEIYPRPKSLAALAGSPLLRLKAIRAHFELRAELLPADADAGEETARRLRLSLTPTDEEVARYVRRLTLDVDVATALVGRAEIVDPDGERTVLVFEDARTNVGLGAGDLAVEVPPGTRVVDAAP